MESASTVDRALHDGDEGEDEERINVLYSAVLDHLLISEAKKEELLATQSLEKKKKMLEMHAKILEPGSSQWSEKEQFFLSSLLSKNKMPDLQNLSRLRIMLTTANREFMTSFLEHGGVVVLLKAMEMRLAQRPLSEIDVSILYELLTCCKALMNNRVGMDGFVAIDGSVSVIARCLNFEYKALALLVIE